MFGASIWKRKDVEVMNQYRKALAKHYCPVCGQRVRRVREPFAEAMLRQILAYPIVGLLGLFIGGALANAGWVEGRWAYILGVLTVLLFAYPFIEQFTRFYCDKCESIHSFSQVTSLSWIFARS